MSGPAVLGPFLKNVLRRKLHSETEKHITSSATCMYSMYTSVNKLPKSKIESTLCVSETSEYTMLCELHVRSIRNPDPDLMSPIKDILIWIHTVYQIFC